MKIDYENYTIYFTEEEISLFDIQKPIKIAKYFESHYNCFLCFSQKKGNYQAIIKETSTINLENNNINITSIYSISDFNFFTAIISVFSNRLKFKKNLETNKIDIDLYENTNNLQTSLSNEHLSLITNLNIGNYSRKINEIFSYVHNFKIPNKYLPLNYLKNLNLPIVNIIHNNNFILNLKQKLKPNPLFVCIELDNNVKINEELSIANNIRVLSIHKYREYFFTGNKKLLVNPLNNLNKTFSKMFENPTNIIKSINKVLDIQKLNSFEIVSDSKIIDYYQDINYYERKGDLGNSCMRHESCKEKIQFYVDEPNISLLVLKLDDKILGRAVLWKCVSGETIMDRIYCCYESLTNLFIEYAQKNKIDFIYNYKERVNNTTGYGLSNFRSELNKNFKVKLNDNTLKNILLEFKNPRPVRDTNFKTLPYLDNFYYLDTVNGFLATNASYENEPNIAYCKSKNNYYHIEDLHWYEPDEEYYLKSDMVITNLNVTVPRELCYSYKNVYYHKFYCERIATTSKSIYTVVPREFCILIINPKNLYQYYVLKEELELFLSENNNYVIYEEYEKQKLINLITEIQSIEQI